MAGLGGELWRVNPDRNYSAQPHEERNRKGCRTPLAGRSEGTAGMSWQKVKPDSSANEIVDRLALTALNFSIQPERMVV